MESFNNTSRAVIWLRIHYDGELMKNPLVYSRGKSKDIKDIEVSKISYDKLKWWIEEFAEDKIKGLFYKDRDNVAKKVENDIDVSGLTVLALQRTCPFDVYVDHTENMDEPLSDEDVQSESSDDFADLDEPFNLDSAHVEYQYSDDDEDGDEASITHLSEGEDELNECRLKNLQKDLNKENLQSDENVPLVPHDTSILKTSELPPNTQPSGSSTYEHDPFLTELCTEYERENFIEKEITSDPEGEVENDERENIDESDRKWPIHNPKTHWKCTIAFIHTRDSNT